MASIDRHLEHEAPPAGPASAGAMGWGNSAPLALAGFATTTFMLSMINANIVPAATTPVVFGVAFMFGGLAQLIAGIICFRNGNVFGGVLFGGFGAFWLSYYVTAAFFLKLVPAAAGRPRGRACCCMPSASSPPSCSSPRSAPT